MISIVETVDDESEESLRMCDELAMDCNNFPRGLLLTLPTTSTAQPKVGLSQVSGKSGF